MTPTETRRETRRDFQAIDAASPDAVKAALREALDAFGRIKRSTTQAFSACDPARDEMQPEINPYGPSCGRFMDAGWCASTCPSRIAWLAIDTIRELLTEGEE